MPFLIPGQLFAERYRVERFIAEGGMGAVFAGVHEATEMPVAIKVLRPSVLSMPGSNRQFELEAKVAARVRSEHIVKVLDAGTDAESGLPYLVMELLEGKSLEHMVAECGPLPADLVVRYLEQVANGLDGAHGYTDADGSLRPIVHRDLKPENLFVVNPDSSSPVVKILDFGIAKVLSDTAGVSQDLRGTPLYMACEQACGQVVTPQTDVWAFGLIAFYLLTGKNYWKSPSLPGGTLASLISEITTLPTTPASHRARELGSEVPLPPAFDEWLERCINRQPQSRFASAGEAVRELALALSLLPYARTIDSRPSPAAAPEVPSTLKSAQGIVDARLGGSTTGQLSVSSTQSPSRSLSKGRAPLLLGAVAVAAAAVGAYLFVGSEPPADAGPAATGVEPGVSSDALAAQPLDGEPVFREPTEASTANGASPPIGTEAPLEPSVSAVLSATAEPSALSKPPTKFPPKGKRPVAPAPQPKAPEPPPPPSEPPKPDDPYGRR